MQTGGDRTKGNVWQRQELGAVGQYDSAIRGLVEASQPAATDCPAVARTATPESGSL